jgi:glucokinase
VVTSLGGSIFDSGVQEVEEGEVLSALESCIRVILSGMKIRAIGIASAGIVETKRGISLRSPHRGDMDNLPLRGFCEEKFGLPVYVDDISRSSAIAEWRLGVLRGERNFVYLFLDEGIGLSWVVDGALYYGPHGISGEVGHFVIDEDGPRCGCGNKGCLEVFASCKAIIRNAQKALQVGVVSSLVGKEVTIENVIAEALRGDKLCYGLLVEAGEYIGRAMAQVLNLTGVPLVVLGGRLSRAGGLIVEPIKRMIRADALSLLGEHLEIRVSSLGRGAGTLGVAIQSLLNVLGILRGEGAMSLKRISLQGVG